MTAGKKFKKLNRKFFTGPTLNISKNILGKYLVRRIGKKILAGKIVETEAYIGPEDRASHAFLPRSNFRPITEKRFRLLFSKFGLDTNSIYRKSVRGGGKITPRNVAEYMIGGHIYIYLVYGMYWQLNISTGKKGSPECFLIRALEPENGQRNLANGPGKLCRWLHLDKSFYGEDVTTSRRLWLEDRGEKIKKSNIASGPRIGIDYAGPVWAKKPWRIYVKNNPFVSASKS